MAKFGNKKRGMSILGALVFGVIIVLVLSYFDVSIKAVVESPTGQENIEYIRGGTKNLWTEYLREPATYFWNNIVLKLFWRPFVDNIERLRDGRLTDLDTAAKDLQINY